MKPIKAYSPFALSSKSFYEWAGRATKVNSDKLADTLAHFLVKDPEPHAWTSMGITDVLEPGRYVHDLDGLARVMVFKFNQRILPAVVRDTEMTKRLTALREAKGDVETKQEYAQIRDDVELELLPKAFIRPAYVPVFIFKDRLLIGNTQAKRLGEIVAVLVRLLDVRKVECEITGFETKNSLSWLLNQAVKDEMLTGDDEGWSLVVGDAAVFKGADKRTVRIKDRYITSDEVQSVVKSDGYAATEVRFDVVTDDGDDVMTVTITDKWAFKGIKLEDSPELAESTADQHATLWYYAKHFNELLGTVLAILDEVMTLDDEPVEEEEL